VAETFPRRTPIRRIETYSTALPVLRCDADKLKRAFAELIENAVSFMPEGGEFRVTTSLIEPGQGPMLARLSPSRRYVQIAFEDSGPGVAEEMKGRIFQPFFSSRVKGMGLGLSIVKGVIDAHHGTIRETGEPGQGARFQIFLPVNGEKIVWGSGNEPNSLCG
jgi:signal transduction histidine kinase